MDILIKQINVRNIIEAIELAETLKISDGCDIFRGQKERWPLHSSLSRVIDANKEKRPYDKLNLFADWVHKNTELQELWDDKDKIMAVAQHYGIPTTFLDFSYSTAVAGFFATDQINKNSKEGCIYCANTSELQRVFEVFRTKLDKVDFRIVKLNVGNLWRLESQKGLFLNAPIAGVLNYWEDFFPFHKIVFQHQRNLKSTIKSEIIYPSRKSRLEIALDQYFRKEEIRSGIKKNEKLGLNIGSIPWKSNLSIFKDVPPPEKLWELEKHIWKKIEIEHMSNAISKKQLGIVITCDDLTIGIIKETFKSAITAALNENVGIKKEAISFRVEFAKQQIKWPASSYKAMELFWDGIRLFQYSIDEIAEGFGNLSVILFTASIKQEKLDSVFGEQFPLEFLADNNSFFTLSLPLAPLTDAFNHSVLADVDTALYPKIKSVTDLLSYVHDVNLLFSFDAFRKLFASYIIPFQVAKNLSIGHNTGEKTTWVTFSVFDVLSMRPASPYLYYTATRFRYHETVISIPLDLSDQELILLMADTYREINKGKKPIKITFAGLQYDEREVYEIPEVQIFCRNLLDLGFVSVMEPMTTNRELPSYDPYALGAFEIWRLAKGEMKYQDYLTEQTFDNFFSDLSKSNIVLKERIKNVMEISNSELEEIKSKGYRLKDL